MRIPPIPVALLSALLAIPACSGSNGDEHGAPLVFAAASLAEALEEAARSYRASGGSAVDFNFGGSNTLASQVAGPGAPADAVLFAGTGPMERLLAAGRVDPDAVRVIARNTLVVVATPGAGPIADLAELASSELLVAIADPALAPAGVYAREALTAVGVWEPLADRLLPSLDVRAALAAVARGNARYGVVYASDARTVAGVTMMLAVPERLHRPIVYTAAPLRDARQSASASAFLAFLAGPAGQAILMHHGFAGRETASGQ